MHFKISLGSISLSLGNCHHAPFSLLSSCSQLLHLNLMNTESSDRFFSITLNRLKVNLIK